MARFRTKGASSKNTSRTWVINWFLLKVKLAINMKFCALCNAGDDCVSIQTGCSDINIHNVNCGPGHGISIGGLGRYNTKACVSNVTVRDVNMFKTMNGVRIKTWQVSITWQLHSYLTSKYRYIHWAKHTEILMQWCRVVPGWFRV